MNRLDAYRLLHDGALALGEVERRGIRIDVEYCDERLAWIDRKHERARRRFEHSPLGAAWLRRFGDKYDHKSIHQLRAVLGADFRVRAVKETETGEASADEESLRRCGVEGADLLLRVRRLKKMRDVLAGLRRSAVLGVAHPSFLLHTVVSYRSSSVAPNFQNQPKRDAEMLDVCRRAIRPSPGYRFIEVDYKGAEVSVGCDYHHDPAMLAYLRDPKSDMHGDMALQIFRLPEEARRAPGFKDLLRYATKGSFVFAEFYGDYYGSVAPNMAVNWLKLPDDRAWRDGDGAEFDGRPIGAHMRGVGLGSLERFTSHLRDVEDDFWNRRFRVYGQWRRDWYREYQRTGQFEMKTGFVVSGLFTRNQVVNFPVQGSAFHCLLWVLIRLVRHLRGWRSAVVAEVHDSMLIDAHPDEFDDVLAVVHELVAALKREWQWLVAPLGVDVMASEVDGSWAEIRELH